MKKQTIIIGSSILLTAILVIGVSLFFFKQEDNQDSVNEYKEFTYLPTVNHEEFKTKLNSGDEFFVYIGRSDCGDSRKFQEEFTKTFVEFSNDGSVADIKYDLNEEDKNFYYFNISEIIPDIKDSNKRMEYKELYGFYFTPSLVHYKDQNEDGVSEPIYIAEWDSIYGFSYADYMQWFYNTGLINPNEEVVHEGQSDKE